MVCKVSWTVRDNASLCYNFRSNECDDMLAALHSLAIVVDVVPIVVVAAARRYCSLDWSRYVFFI